MTKDLALAKIARKENLITNLTQDQFGYLKHNDKYLNIMSAKINDIVDVVILQ